eukprot:CAMPEP_0170422440 /NCGR_PEP_ID=MMETSP0117_2-20130122/36450_1 /TAXON_ID=400756 /ORGANISM="Durinskia baltica, Strain CSIRO CS-38" /LENGTH=68 /DNA_ID=CAMNT_0010681091 /DNA_START=41 /DNA_END=243 /DNA_ORIENTATION=-
MRRERVKPQRRAGSGHERRSSPPPKAPPTEPLYRGQSPCSARPRAVQRDHAAAVRHGEVWLAALSLCG